MSDLSDAYLRLLNAAAILTVAAPVTHKLR